MDKVLVTTPRVGSSMKNREVRENRRQQREGLYDDLPRYSSMKPKSRGWDNRKYLNEYLNPLVRFLQKNCNRPWNKVYSEICNNMDRRSAVKGHIFDHLLDYVCVKPTFKNKKPYTVGYNGLSPLYRTGWTFYVDQNGLLREPKERRPPWKSNESNPNIIKTDDENVFIIKRTSDKTWFRAHLEDWPDNAFYYLSHKNPDWVVEALGNSIIGTKRVVIKTLSKKDKKLFNIT